MDEHGELDVQTSMSSLGARLSREIARQDIDPLLCRGCQSYLAPEQL